MKTAQVCLSALLLATASCQFYAQYQPMPMFVPQYMPVAYQYVPLQPLGRPCAPRCLGDKDKPKDPYPFLGTSMRVPNAPYGTTLLVPYEEDEKQHWSTNKSSVESEAVIKRRRRN